MSDWIKVFAPATVANVGPGFDIMGFAVNEPGDIVAVRASNHPGVRIAEIRYAKKSDEGNLSVNPKKNTAGVAAVNVLTLLQKRGIVGKRIGIELTIQKNMPIGSGLGSSGASAVAAAWAVNLLFGAILKKSDPDLILACVEAEATLSGFHADNVAPAMLGGFVLIRSYNPLDIIPLDAPENMVCVLVSPHYYLPTRESRATLPQYVPFREVVVPHCANVAGVVAGILKKDLALLGRAIDDKIVEPARAHLIPGFLEVKETALKQGAFGCSISGAGPSVFAITDDLEKGRQIGQAMASTFAQYGLADSAIYVSHINRDGAKQIE
jgi:homoserine kinase